MQSKSRISAGLVATIIVLGVSTASADAPAQVEAATAAVTRYGDVALKTGALSCTGANGTAGAVLLPQLSTGGVIRLAGAVASGSIAMKGSDGLSRTGTGDVALGLASAWNASRSTFDLGGAAAGYYAVDVGAQMPADESAADAMFDVAFGAPARYGVSLGRVRRGPRGNAEAFYNYTSAPIAAGGRSGQAAVAVGIVAIDGRVKAIQLTGIGAFAQYAK